jgi:VanZ family protein
MKLRNRIYQYIFWLGYFAVLVTTFIPVSGELNKRIIGTEALHIRLDHLLHLLVYFLISMFYLFGMRNGFTLFKRNSLLIFIMLILFLATITEVIQLWVPARTFNPMDLIANIIGLTAGIAVIVAVKGHKSVT